MSNAGQSEQVLVPISTLRATPSALAVCSTRLEPTISLSYLRAYMAHYVTNVHSDSLFIWYTPGLDASPALRDVFSWKERRRFTLVTDPGFGLREQLLALYDCFARTSIRQAAFTLHADLDEFLITPPPPAFDQFLRGMFKMLPHVGFLNVKMCDSQTESMCDKPRLSKGATQCINKYVGQPGGRIACRR